MGQCSSSSNSGLVGFTHRSHRPYREYLGGLVLARSGGGGSSWKLLGRDSDIKLEDAGSLDGVPSSAHSCSPYFVLLCPSLCLLCVALTRLVGFALEP
jgi:hypothetical protein